MLSSPADEIEAYSRQIERDGTTCGRDTCPSCGRTPKFRYHSRRRRIFLVLVDTLVRTVHTFLLRWRCPLCNVRFTDYPSFALPHKRYTRPRIMEKCCAYVENNDGDEVKTRLGRETRTRRRSTYRKGAGMKDGRPIAYEGGEENSLDKRAFSHTTIHRWVTWLGQSAAALKAAAVQLILAMNSSSTIHRLRPAIHPGKHRTETRRDVLEDVFSYFRARDEYRDLYGKGFFPDFAPRKMNV